VKLSEVDLNLLVIFDALVKERSVTGAGRAVGLSQPAASAALRRLRDLFGDPLIERVGARSRLTPLAIALTEPVQQILASIETTFNHRSGFEPATSQHVFRIAAADDVAYVFLQPLLERLTKIAPRVHVQVERPGPDTGDRLATRQVEFSIEPELRYRNRDFQFVKLYQDQWVVAAWSGNTLIGNRLTREQFAELGHVTISMRPYAFNLIDRVLGGLSQRLNVQVVTDGFAGLAMLLRGTNLIALMPGRLAAVLQPAADIRLLAPPMQLNDIAFTLWWPPLFQRDAAHAWLREVIVDVAKGLEAQRVLAEAL
jgi:LysR family transcriptional regulator, nod-box dependent transcriptional activator